MKKDEITSILRELYKISGFRVSLHGTDFSEIAAYPSEPLPFCKCLHKNAAEYNSCVLCDADACRKALTEKRTIIYKCRYGLTEAVSPLYNFGTLTGYLMMGQVSNGEADDERLRNAIISYCSSKDEAAKLVSTVPLHTDERINSYVKIMTICAEYITLINALPGQKPSIAELAKMYILENHSKKITINDICHALGCSKSTLLSAFKSQYGITVNSYLCEVRIGEAKKMLSGTDMSINEIAEATGFYDQAYFSRVFSQKEGLTPSDYRRKQNENNTYFRPAP